MEDLGYLVEVGDDHSLKDDTHIRCEEQFDRYDLLISWISLVNEFDFGCKSLQICQNQEDEHRSCQLTQIVCIGSCAGMDECLPLGLFGH